MSFLFICTGKKKAVDKALKYLTDLAGKKTVEILGQKRATKTAMFWKYDELKVLFNSEKAKLEIDKDILKSLDYARLQRKESLAIKMSTFMTEDDWQRGSIISLTGPFQMRGGQLNILTEKKEETRRAVKRATQFIISGPNALTTSYKDLLVEKKVADPSTVEYVL